MYYLNLPGTLNTSNMDIGRFVKGTRFNFIRGLSCHTHDRLWKEDREITWCALGYARTRAFEMLREFCHVFKIPMSPGTHFPVE